jgi:hypothetical protein
MSGAVEWAVLVDVVTEHAGCHFAESKKHFFRLVASDDDNVVLETETHDVA